MGDRYDTLKAAYSRAVIIAISLMVSVLVYVVVAEMLHKLVPPWKGIAFTTDHWYYEYIRCGLLALGIIGVLLASKISTAVNLSPEKLANPAPALITHTVALSAACDAMGTCGFVLFLMAGNITDVYIFGGLSLGLQVVFFPSFSRWEESSESGLSNPAPEVDEQKEQTGLEGVSTKRWKCYIIMICVFLFLWLAIAFNRENAFEESYNLPLWAGLFPLTVIALLYFFFKVFFRLAQASNLAEEYHRTRPAFKHLFSVIMSLLTGLILCFLIRSALVGAMDELNDTPIQVESIISEVGWSSDCRLELFLAPKCSICLQYRESRPVETPWPLGKMRTDEIYKLVGQRVILVGRKSWAGTVIDEIRLPSDKASEATSTSAAESNDIAHRVR